jgi:2-polyprenyl-6-methoxyphenol hydroxylase-like FAD-dependent oxidoreductase
VATLPVEPELNPTTDVLLYGMPGRLASVHPVRGDGGIAAFIWRSKPVPGYDYRDTAQHKRIVEQAYAGGGWVVPELIERVRDAGDLYFDAVSQVRLDTWSKGHIGLLGDAASSVSLFGDGSSLAMAGAYTLARTLAEHRDDLRQGLKAYEYEHRKLVAPKQNGFAIAATLMVPATRPGWLPQGHPTTVRPVARMVAGQRTGRMGVARQGSAPPGGPHDTASWVGSAECAA